MGLILARKFLKIGNLEVNMQTEWQTKIKIISFDKK